MAEAGGNQSAQIIGLRFGRNMLRHGLPGIAWALDNLDRLSFHFRVSNHSMPKPSRWIAAICVRAVHSGFHLAATLTYSP